MNQTAMIVSMISILGCLVLALRSSRVQALDKGQILKLAAIWTAIIVGLVLVIRISGFRIEP